ncbi:DUF2029 domain-containing protein [Tabrizicola piscis]|uniref:DUF2029 domain-containing protein n=1 Tax=Tabrizicola piscis TaxID=2494374 RepID=A0A3S8U1U3_9RHOB|nr:glycosyltransferase family 87 protein [Tabrizicola piscis]AZL57556.1 DUF2029 domain-containing protein [Tabrizicola piscis]
MQDTQTRLAADARLQPFSSRTGFYAGGITAICAGAFVSLILVVAYILTSNPDVLAMSVDFRVFWAAGKLAVSGEPLAAHDLARLSAVHGLHVDAYMPWLYPPGFLVFVTPFGAVSFMPAFLLWTILSMALIALAVRPFVAGITPLWLMVALAPAHYPTLMLGQNSLFWTAGLVAALAALRDSRWVLAGIFIGCLTLKPQLGVMIPFALLAMGAWRTIFAAIMTTIVLHGVPTLVYGVEYWSLLRAGLAEHSERVVGSLDQIILMISPVYTLTFFGMAPPLALNIQWAISIACAAAVFLLWRSERASFDVKAAALLMAIPLSAPYLWYYEGALLACAALFLLRSGIFKVRPFDLAVLAPLWLGGSLQALNTFADLVDQRWLGAAYLPPLLIICLGLCLREILPRRTLAMP